MFAENAMKKLTHHLVSSIALLIPMVGYDICAVEEALTDLNNLNWVVKWLMK